MSEKAVYYDLPELKITEFERILQLYGMNKKDFCDLRGKTKSWFHNTLRKNSNELGFVPFENIKVLVNHIGQEVFEQIYKKITNESSKNATQHDL